MNSSIQARLATAKDRSFLDHLQTKFSKQLGYMPLQAIERHCEKGQCWLAIENGQPAGYVLGAPRYHGLDACSIIYQAAVPYDAQRRAVGTLLVTRWCEALPAESKQVALWCAQDIEANLFWASLGFAPLAYRVGSIRQQRVHVYWSLTEDGQRSYIPDVTGSGLLRERRPVVHFEPGQGWNDKVRVDWNAFTPPPPPDPKPRRATGRAGGRAAAARLEAARKKFAGEPSQLRLVWGGRVVLLPSTSPPRVVTLPPQPTT